MIDELKELVGIVNSLPQLALWVAIGFWAYKVIVVGSIYGVIRMVIQKIHAAYTSPKREQIEVAVEDLVYCTRKAQLVSELKRILPADKYESINSNSAINWLSAAITEKLEKDGPPKK